MTKTIATMTKTVFKSILSGLLQPFAGNERHQKSDEKMTRDEYKMAKENRKKIPPYAYPFDRKSKIGKEARRKLKIQRVGGTIVNTKNPEQFVA